MILIKTNHPYLRVERHRSEVVEVTHNRSAVEVVLPVCYPEV
jgi:hypothetical protein